GVVQRGDTGALSLGIGRAARGINGGRGRGGDRRDGQRLGGRVAAGHLAGGDGGLGKSEAQVQARRGGGVEWVAVGGVLCGGRQVNRRIPVAVGVGDTSLVETIELARFAAESGADAVVVGVPCYLPPSQEELIEYVRGIVGEQPLPVVLYNIPVLTKVGFGVETVVRLAEEPKVVGIKDSGGDLEYVRSVIARLGRADWSILVGVESLLLRAMRCGAHGGVL